MLQTFLHDWFVIAVIVCAKTMFFRIILFSTTNVVINRVKLVLIVDESWVVALLGHLCKVWASAEAHGHLSVLAFLIVMQCLSFFQESAIDPFEHIFKAIVATIDVIGTAILHWQDLLQLCNAGWLPELLLSAYLTHLCGTALTRYFTYSRWVAGRGRGRLADEVCVHLCVPGSFCFSREADLG